MSSLEVDLDQSEAYLVPSVFLHFCLSIVHSSSLAVVLVLYGALLVHSVQRGWDGMEGYHRSTIV